MLDANGNYIPDDSWEQYLQQMNRQASAAGGVPPAPDRTVQQPQYDAPISPDMPPGYLPPATPVQQELAKPVSEGGLGIKTYGPNAESGKRAEDAYKQDISQAESVTGQGQPQQFGVEEPMGQDKGPLSPPDAAQAFADKAKAAGGYDALAKSHTLGYPSYKGQAAYDQYVEQDRAKRDAERNRLREQGSLNRQAMRAKDEDMWASLRATNVMQGGGIGGDRSMGGGGGFGATNVGGAILLGPGMGAYGYGRGGRGGGMSPEQLALHQQELEERMRKNRANEDLGGQRNQNYADKNAIAREANQAVNDRFKIVNGQKIEKSFDEKRATFDELMAEEDRRAQAMKAAMAAGADPATAYAAAETGKPKPDPLHPGKTVPGVAEPGTYQGIQRRILTLGQELAKAHEAGKYNFTVTPEVIRRWEILKQAQEAEKMATPSP